MAAIRSLDDRASAPYGGVRQNYFLGEEMENKENSLLEQYNNYKRTGTATEWIPQNEAISKWMTQIYSHVENKLLPHLKSKDQEYLVNYWPVYLIWGQSNDVKYVLQAGHTVRERKGFYGTGYIAVTDQKIYLFSFQELTREFPLLRKGCFFGNFLAGVAGQEDNRRASKEDKNWSIPASEVANTKIYEEEFVGTYIALDSTYGQWQVYNYFTGQIEDIQTAIMMARNGRFPLESSPQASANSKQHSLLEQLDNLRHEGVITQEEYETKKKNILDKI